MPPPPNDPRKPPSKAEPVPNLTETYLPSQDASQIPSSPAPSLELPAELLTLTQYQVLKEIGAGGMGLVYLAMDTFLRRHVVLKVVKTERLHRSSAIQRFINEMQAAARLNHSNVVIAYTWHQVNEFLVFVMEYVPGEDLSKIVKSQGRMAVTNAAYYVHQVARGLQHAHENGLVHRDIKPSNLILNKNGKKHTVKILDFGLAKARSEEDGQDTGLTGTNKFLGTPDYASPEQIRDAASADIRADLYSLGCTLYYLLAGEPPFRGRNEFELQEAHVFKTARPLNLLRAEVPLELANIVNKLMAKDPAKRYQTPAELVVALTPFLKGGLSSAGTGPQPIILIEEDNERSGDGNKSNKTGTVKAAPAAVPTTPPAAKPVVAKAIPLEDLGKRNLPDFGKAAEAAAIPTVASDKSKTAEKSGPVDPPTARVDDTKESDDRRSRVTRADDLDRPRHLRQPIEIKSHIWWLIWGYLQLVFFLLVAGVTAHFLVPREYDAYAMRPGSNKSTSEKSDVGKDPFARGPDTKKPSDLPAGTVSNAGSGSGSLLLFEAPAIFGLFYLFFAYSQPRAAVNPKPTRWADRNWWIGTFLLCWLLGLACASLFIDSGVLMVVAFLIVLGLGAGISVFLSRSTGNAPQYDDEDDRPRRRSRDDDDRP